MTPDELEALLTRHPIIYHVTAAGAWRSIRAHGLLSTSALLDWHGIGGADRARIEGERRPASIMLSSTGKPIAVVRDQVPMTNRALIKCLEDDLSPSDWYRLLNSKVFFWLTGKRLNALLGAAPYRSVAHDVIEIDSRQLVQAYHERIWLCPINSGNTRRRAMPRGRTTFRRISEFPYAERCRTHGWQRAIAELAVDDAVLDVAHFVRRVVSRQSGHSPKVIYEA